jgi:drug/metabolite transporter (DMT)-like permease
MMLGLMRWPSIHWHLALAFAQAAPPEQAVIAATFDGLNTYLGNFIGEFLGELAVSMFFLLTAFVWLRSPQRARWVGWIGVVIAALGLIGMFRNITTIVAPVAEVNNYLLPLFMIILGVAFIRWRTNAAAEQSNARSAP